MVGSSSGHEATTSGDGLWLGSDGAPSQGGVEDVAHAVVNAAIAIHSALDNLAPDFRFPGRYSTRISAMASAASCSSRRRSASHASICARHSVRSRSAAAVRFASRSGRPIARVPCRPADQRCTPCPRRPAALQQLRRSSTGGAGSRHHPARLARRDELAELCLAGHRVVAPFVVRLKRRPVCRRRQVAQAPCGTRSARWRSSTADTTPAPADPPASASHPAGGRCEDQIEHRRAASGR